MSFMRVHPARSFSAILLLLLAPLGLGGDRAMEAERRAWAEAEEAGEAAEAEAEEAEAAAAAEEEEEAVFAASPLL